MSSYVTPRTIEPFTDIFIEIKKDNLPVLTFGYNDLHEKYIVWEGDYNTTENEIEVNDYDAGYKVFVMKYLEKGLNK